MKCHDVKEYSLNLNKKREKRLTINWEGMQWIREKPHVNIRDRSWKNTMCGQRPGVKAASLKYCQKTEFIN